MYFISLSRLKKNNFFLPTNIDFFFLMVFAQCSQFFFSLNFLRNRGHSLFYCYNKMAREALAYTISITILITVNERNFLLVHAINFILLLLLRCNEMKFNLFFVYFALPVAVSNTCARVHLHLTNEMWSVRFDCIEMWGNVSNRHTGGMLLL